MCQPNGEPRDVTAEAGPTSRLRAALDAARDAVLVTDRAGVILETNLAILELNGLTREEVLGRPLLELAAAAGADEAELAGIRAALSGEAAAYTSRRRNRRGELVSVTVSATLLPDGAGVVFVTQGLEANRELRARTAYSQVLARTAETLGSPTGLDETLSALADVLVPQWADGMMVAVAGRDGRLEVAAVRTAEGVSEEEVLSHLPPTLADTGPATLLGRVAREGRPLLIGADRSALGAQSQDVLAELLVDSLILVPLSDRSELLGVLCVSTLPGGRSFDERDLDLFANIGERAAQAVRAAGLEEDRRRAESRFRAAFDHAPIGITISSEDEGGVPRFVEVNPAFGAIVGYPPSVLNGRPIADFTHPDDRDAEARRMRWLTEERVEETSGETRLVRPSGELRWVSIRGAPLGDGTIVAQVQDITERKRFESELEHLASHDTLTGVLNRRSFEVALKSALAHVHRHGDQAAVITLDMDNFKHINDTYGHAAGDDVLRGAADALLQRLRATDQLGRLGGDEFGVILSRTDPTAARTVARELLESLRDVRIRVGERDVRVTASAGLRVLEPRDTLDADALLSEADLAMYDAKERGRDRLAVVRPGDLQPAKIRARLRWSERIRDALEGTGFVLYEQPILRLADDVIDRSELLIRLADGQDPEQPVVEPAGFLDVAERFGQIQAIDRWVVRAAIELLVARQAAGDMRTAEVNLSGDSISDPSVVDFIVAQVRGAAIDPSSLIFEVTETSAIGNLEHARVLAERLTALGCGFALDDFGSGFGSFAYLKHLPLGIIKIDGQFVRGLSGSHADQVTVRAIVDVARGLGKETVAEYVENAETLELLRELGVDRAQGFHIGRPEPVQVLSRIAQR